MEPILRSMTIAKASAVEAGAPAGPPAQVQAAVGRSRPTSTALMTCGIVVLLLTAVAETLYKHLLRPELPFI
jgi:hypothetical protein